jgi:hypothetical protein
MSAMICPFCGERDYDTPGLKNHIEHYCDRYRLVDSSVCGTPFTPPAALEALATTAKEPGP